MVNGFRYYRALESVSIESALFTALTIYPCQIRLTDASATLYVLCNIHTGSESVQSQRLAVCPEQRNHEASKETTQDASQSVSPADIGCR